MSNQIVRPYELSLWTLQDDFITVLKSPSLSHKGQISEPTITIKSDGTQEINFLIPMYIFNGIELVENPIWYNVINGTLIANLRKVKVIFNKGDNGLEKVYEFIINKVVETHIEGKLNCEVSGTGLAFQELGKTGYKIYFGLDEFEKDYEDWFVSEKGEEPIANINYWADKIFDGTNWSYEVQMDWSAFDGELELSNEVRIEKGLRRTDKIYEEEYIASWEANNNSLTPTRYETFREKARIVSAEKSNRYNLTQTLAETFGVFCRYEYEYDDNYHIIGRKCIFYNTFLDEKNGRIDIDYPYQTNSITRELDSSDVTTKLYVTPISEVSSPNGLISIADVNANKTYDDFILNFDYLRSIGTISEEQYAAIGEHETNLYLINKQLEPLQNKLNEIDLLLPEARGKLTIAEDGINQANEEIRKAEESMRALLGDTKVLERTDGNPVQVVLLQDLSISSGYYVNLRQEGIIANTIRLYEKYEHGLVNTPLSGFRIVTDDCGNVTKLTGLSYNSTNGSKFRYVTFSYQPSLHYERIIEAYTKRRLQDAVIVDENKKLVEDLEKEREELNQEIEQLLDKKQSLINHFERLMGPALREGSWQADNYANYGKKGQENISYIGEKGKDLIISLWDEEPLDGEQLSYFEESVNQNKTYYYVLNIESVINKLREAGLKNIFLAQGDQRWGIGSQLHYSFFKRNNEIIPGIIIADPSYSPAGTYYLTQINVSNKDGTFFEEEFKISGSDNLSFINQEQYLQVFPRIVINSDLVQNTTDSIIVKNAQNKVLERYYDYSVYLKNLLPYITLKSETVLTNITEQNTNWKLNGYDISYTLTNAALDLYLDALEVARENAYPRASYEVELNVFDENILKDAYNLLGKIAHINDRELHFENVQGYISELELKLDTPWEDSFTIQNYKTKFEDLFTRIVASSEQMKTNALVYDRAASAFDSNGALKTENIQQTLNQSDLNYSFANGTLTIDEQNGIWGISDEGVVAYRGGGIFTSNSKDASGNWIWNSGITPNGINASLLNAGQINTNLIKIYAGDNVRFQMNSEGLFAYGINEDGTANANNYVVHNSEGLFLVDDYVDKNDIVKLYNQVEVGYDGFIIRNHNYITDTDDGKVFYADENGDLTLRGYIYAKGGEIGGWTLDNNSLYSSEYQVGMASGALENNDLTEDENGRYIVFWAGRNDKKREDGFYDDAFQVLSDGSLYATNATLSGNSKIGNLTVQQVEDGASATNSIQLIANTGTFFHISSTTGGAVLPEALEFTWKKNGIIRDKTFSSFKIYGDLSGNFNSQEKVLADLDENATNFIISYNELLNKMGVSSFTVIHLKAVMVIEDKEYIDYISINTYADGKDGTSERYWLRFKSGDNYYKWIKELSGETTYDFNPSVMEVDIIYGDGVNTSQIIEQGEYSVEFQGSNGEGTWTKLESSYNEAEHYYSLNLLNVTGWDSNRIKVCLLKNGQEVSSEIKNIAYGTSEQAAKFDFVASGAYWSTNGLNYTFNDQGFKIERADVNDNGEINEDTKTLLFGVDDDGNLSLSGKIQTSVGKIGAWTINENGITATKGDSNIVTGVISTNQSLYYLNASDSENINYFTQIYDFVYDEIDEVSKNRLTQISLGTEPVFYAGIREENRPGIHYVEEKAQWKSFETNTTYTFSVLANGLVYTKNLALDGSLFLSDKISFLGDGDVDKHIFSIKPRDELFILNPAESDESLQNENILFGVQKNNTGYNFAITHTGSVSIADREIFIGGEGLFVTGRREEGEELRVNPLASGFGTSIIYDNEKLASIPFLWAGSFAGGTDLTGIDINNTAFFVDSFGITNIAKGILNELVVEKTSVFKDTVKFSGENISAEKQDNRVEFNSKNYVDYNGAVILGETFIQNGRIGLANDFDDNIHFICDDEKGIMINGYKGGAENNTFFISNSGEASFSRIVANEIQTSEFSIEEIASMNGSLLLAQHFKYLSYGYDSEQDKYIFEIKKDYKDAVNEKDLVCLDINGTLYHLVITLKEINEGNDSYSVEASPLQEINSFIPNQGVCFVLGGLQLTVVVSEVGSDYFIFDVSDSSTKEAFKKYLNFNYYFRDSKENFFGEVEEVDDSFKLTINNGINSVTAGQTITLVSSNVETRGRIYLRALDNEPEILLYRSFNFEEKTFNSQLNNENLTVKIGNLNNIQDQDFSSLQPSGNGLYSENVFLKGSIILPSAGLTNDNSHSFNYDNWDKANSNTIITEDKSPIRFWAGAAGERREEAPLIITENGSLYASQGIFQGQVIATDGLFSGFISSTGVLLKDKPEGEGSSNFFFAVKKEAVEGEESVQYTMSDYLIDITESNGLEIYDNGFCVFSGNIRDKYQNIYLDGFYPNAAIKGYNYQFPYISTLQNEQSLISYNIDVLQFNTNVSSNEQKIDYSYAGLRQTANTLIWYQSNENGTLEPGSNTAIWQEKYKEAISSDNRNVNYTIKVEPNKLKLGTSVDVSSFTFGENTLTCDKGKCVIESVTGGINIKVME